MKIHSLIFTAATALAGLSATTLVGGKNIPNPTREIKAGNAVFAIPRHLPDKEKRGTLIDGAVILGLMDERELCYFQFLGIYWSKTGIADSILLPSPAYKKETETSTPIPFAAGIHARLTMMRLSATKPCGRIVKEELGIVRFFNPETKMHYAVSGFTTPATGQDDLIAIARSIHSQKSTGRAP